MIIVLALAAGTAVAECPNVSSSVATKAGQRKAAARERPAKAAPAPPEAAPASRDLPQAALPRKTRPRLCAHRSCRAGRDGHTKPINRTREAPRAAGSRTKPTNNTGLLRPRHLRHVRRCICYPNWQEADCRADLPFVPARRHAKGDLDGRRRAERHGHDRHHRSTVYPHGTTEQYPLMVDSAGGSLTNTGHAYAEYGNKGICDRKSGECDCFGLLGRGLPEGGLRRRDIPGHGVA